MTGVAPVTNDVRQTPPVSAEAALSAERFAAALTAASAPAAPAAVTPAVATGRPLAMPAAVRGFVTLGQMASGSAQLGALPLAGALSDASGFAAVFGAAAGGVTTGGVAGPAFSGAGSGRGAQAVDAASRYLGIPYKWGGTNPATGLDCSGFVQRAFADIGVQLPRVSIDQSKAGVAVPSLAEAQPGDLIYWGGGGGRPNHIGIYLGDGQMMHAPRTGDVVKIGPIRSAPPHAIRRVV